MVSFSFLGLNHQEPTGSGRATPTSTFQHRTGHLPVSILGPLTLAEVFIGDKVNNALDARKKDIIKTQIDTEKASVIEKEAAKLAEEAAKLAEEATKKAQELTESSVNDAQKAMRKAVSDAESVSKLAQETAKKDQELTKSSANDARSAVQKAVSDTERVSKLAQETVKKAQELANRAVNDAEKAVQKAVSDAEAATKRAKGKAKAAEDAARRTLARLRELNDSMAQTEGRILERRGDRSILGLTEDDKAAILVHQIPRKTGEQTRRGKKWVELVFKLEIDALETKRAPTEILN
jgi:dGTP triphosphohydrolase